MGERFLIRTFGCQMNEHDSERIAALLSGEGMQEAAGPGDADVVVLNTCCIRENADNKLYGTLGHLKAEKARRPGLRIVVGGCLAQKDGEEVRRRAPHVDVVMGTHNVHRAAELLERARRDGPLTDVPAAADAEADDHELFPTALGTRRETGHSAWVTVQIGCDNSCAFCIVPAVRGPEVSRAFGELVDDVRLLAEAGVTEVTLLGQNVNSYGRDLTRRLRPAPPGPDDSRLAGPQWAVGARRARPLFADLLRAVGRVDGIRRVRFTSPHPKDLLPETIAAMASTPAVCEHLHLPLQSGSDRVLAAMHRGYTAQRYLDRVDRARALIDDLAVTTDLIVGFPGETERDFQATLAVAAEVGFDAAYTFVYSPRPGTEAATAVERFVDPSVSVERMSRLRAVVERSSRSRNQRHVGRTEEVLVLGPSRKDANRLTGRTRHNKLVHFAAPRTVRPGSYAEVTVTGAELNHLRGELVEVTAAPRHRVRIPVAPG